MQKLRATDTVSAVSPCRTPSKVQAALSSFAWRAPGIIIEVGFVA
jgi:hypothetical protein